MIEADQKEAYRLLHDGILAFSKAEQQGIRIDLEYCKKTKAILSKKIKKLTAEFESTKFYRHWKHANRGKKPNINSNQQLAWFLYKIKKLKPAKITKSGQGATSEEALENLNLPEIKTLIRIRKYKKLRDTYLAGFMKEQVNGYIHPHFNLHITRTYRSSSNAPNFQNIPKRDKEAQKICRRALFPRPGHLLLEVDYSGIEVCVSACYHKDPMMIKYIKNPESDMHRDMAQEIFFLNNFDKSISGHSLLRSAAKNGFVFPQFYGDYYKNCAHSLACSWGDLPEKGYWKNGQGIEIASVGGVDPIYLSDQLISNGVKSLRHFTSHIKKIEKHFWQSRFPVYARWKKKWYSEYLKNGYIDMLTGFRCHGPMGRNDATNYPIQGSAFHCLLWSFIELQKLLTKGKYKTKLIGQIHDAMVLDVHPDELEDIAKLLNYVMIDQLMKTWKWIIVPLSIEIDIGAVDGSWAELKPYNQN